MELESRLQPSRGPVTSRGWMVLDDRELALLPCRAALERAAACAREGRRGTAWRILIDGLHASPHSPGVALPAARLFLALGDDDHAFAAASIALRDRQFAALPVLLSAAQRGGLAQSAIKLLAELSTATDVPRELHDGLWSLLAQGNAGAEEYRVLGLANAPLPDSPTSCLRRAQRLASLGDVRGAHRLVASAAEMSASSPDDAAQSALAWMRLGEFTRAEGLLRSFSAGGTCPPAALLVLCRLELWRGRDEAAEQAIAGLPEGSRDTSDAQQLLVICDVLQQRYASALARADRLLADASQAGTKSGARADGETRLWRARARWALGDLHGALRDCDEAGPDAGRFAARLLRHVIELDLTRAASDGRDHLSADQSPTQRRGGAQRDSFRDALLEELAAPLAWIDPNSSSTIEHGGTESLRTLLAAAVSSLAGNLGASATYIDSTGELRRLPVVPTVRDCSRQVLESLRCVPPATARQRLSELQSEQPDSAMPAVHLGELLLWTGDYDAACTELRRAIEIRRDTRWAWYGLAWQALLTDGPDAALARCDEGIAALGGTEAAGAWILRGEAWRRQGKFADARDALDRSRRLHPRRLSAWVNLGLVYDQQGDERAFGETMLRIFRMAPAACFRAARRIGDGLAASVVDACAPAAPTPLAHADAVAVLAELLDAMRGNRSSSCVTYFDRGRMLYSP